MVVSYGVVAHISAQPGMYDALMCRSANKYGISPGCSCVAVSRYPFLVMNKISI